MPHNLHMIWLLFYDASFIICSYVPISHNFVLFFDFTDFISLKNMFFYSSTIKSSTISDITTINACYMYSHRDYAMASNGYKALPFMRVAM